MIILKETRWYDRKWLCQKAGSEQLTFKKVVGEGLPGGVLSQRLNDVHTRGKSSLGRGKRSSRILVGEKKICFRIKRDWG